MWVSINVTNYTDGVDGLSGTLSVITLFTIYLLESVKGQIQLLITLHYFNSLCTCISLV